MKKPTLSQLEYLALIEAVRNQEVQGIKVEDDVDILIPVLCSAISSENKPYTTREISILLSQSLGTYIQYGFIEYLISRAKKKHNIVVSSTPSPTEGQNITFNYQIISEINEKFITNKEDIVNSIELLVHKFVLFIKNTYNKDILEDRAKKYILSFFMKFKYGYDFNEDKGKFNADKYLVARFIAASARIDENINLCVDKIIKGTLIASYFSNIPCTSRKKDFKNISVYIDTPILLALLEISSEYLMDSLKDFYSLLVSYNINIFVFDRTRNEALSILTGIQSYIASNRSDLIHPGVLQSLKNKKITKTKIDLTIESIDEKIRNLGITIVSNYEIIEIYNCDVAGLKDYLFEKGVFREGRNFDHDLFCIMMLHNMRHGKQIKHLDEAFSIFITLNSSLYKESIKFLALDSEKQYKAGNRKFIPPVQVANWLSSILWLKKADSFLNMPLENLVATTYSIINAHDKFVDDFYNDLNTLKDSDIVSENSIDRIRFNGFTNIKVHDSIIENEGKLGDTIDLIEKINHAEYEDEVKYRTLLEKIVTYVIYVFSAMFSTAIFSLISFIIYKIVCKISDKDLNTAFSIVCGGLSGALITYLLSLPKRITSYIILYIRQK